MVLRWGIVTAGKISHDFVNAFNSYPNIGNQKICAVAARDKTKAAEFAKIHNIPKVFNTYEDLAKSNDIDVAYIGAINCDHYWLAKLYLESGKHVLCEKPLCMNLKQTQSLVNIAKSKKLFLMEALWSRFAPSYIALEKEIESGKLGDVQYVEVNYGIPVENMERVKTKELGGGVTLDVGVYTLNFAQFIYKDEPIKVTAYGELSNTGVDAVATVILEYTGGRRAVLNLHSRLKLWNKATVYGPKGKATLDHPFHFADTLIHVDGKAEKFALHTSNLSYNFINSPGLVYQALEVERCIREGLLESPRMPHKESLILAKLRDTVRSQLGVRFSVDDEEY